MRIKPIDLQNLVARLRKATRHDDLILWQTRVGDKLMYRVKRKQGDRIVNTPFSDRDYTSWELALCIRFALRALVLRREL